MLGSVWRQLLACARAPDDGARSACQPAGPACRLALQERATAFIDGVKKDPQCWQLCVTRFSETGYAEVKFWCLSTLHEVRCQRGTKDVVTGAGC